MNENRNKLLEQKKFKLLIHNTTNQNHEELRFDLIITKISLCQEIIFKHFIMKEMRVCLKYEKLFVEKCVKFNEKIFPNQFKYFKIFLLFTYIFLKRFFPEKEEIHSLKILQIYICPIICFMPYSNTIL